MVILPEVPWGSLCRSRSGKRWKIFEIGLAVPLQACPDMALYCSFAFIAFDYKLARIRLSLAPWRVYPADFKKCHGTTSARVLSISYENISVDYSSEATEELQMLWKWLEYFYLSFYSCHNCNHISSKQWSHVHSRNCKIKVETENFCECCLETTLQ